MSSPEERGTGDRPPEPVADGAARWGASAPPMLRAVALTAWLAFTCRLVSTALPGARSGIESLIRRADTTSSVLSQLAVLIGASELVLLVVATVSEQTLGYAYRILVVPSAATVLMLVMLASTTGLEPEAVMLLAASCLVLSAVATGASLKTRISRAHGLVLLAVTLWAATRFGVRLYELYGVRTPVRTTWLVTAGRLLDGTAVSLAAVRLVVEWRSIAAAAMLSALGLSTLVAWGGIRGSMDGAALWQVLASRALADLGGTARAGLSSGHYAVDAFAWLVSGVIALWPGTLSAGIVSAGLALLARPGVDVPACALALSLGALLGPLAAGTGVEPQLARPAPPLQGSVPKAAPETDP